MLFREVLGLVKSKKELVSGYSQKRIAHAQLLYGARGSGKLALALSYSRFLNCESPLNQDSCDLCLSCLKFSKLAHPDLHIIFPVIKKSSTDKPLSDDFVDLWREVMTNNPYQSLESWMSLYKEQYLEKISNKKKEGVIYSHQIKELNRKLSLKIYEAKYRVVIIWMPEKMNIRAANKFLKLLEEPPKKTILLLVSENKNSLLSTVLSRLQAIGVPSYTVSETIAHFKNNKTDSFINYCKRSNGDLGRIYNYSKDEGNEDSYIEKFSALMRACFKNNIIEIANWADDASAKTRENQVKLLDYSLVIIRECLIYNYSDKKMNILSEKEEGFIKNFATYINEENSLPIIELFENGIKQIKRNANSKIIFFDMLLQLVKLLKLKRKFA